MLTMEKNRLTLAIPKVARDIKAHIIWLGQRLKDVDGKLKTLPGLSARRCGTRKTSCCKACAAWGR